MMGTLSLSRAVIFGGLSPFLSGSQEVSVSGTEGFAFARKGGQLIHVAFLEASCIPFLDPCGDQEHKTTGHRPNRSSGPQGLGSLGYRQVH